MAEPMNFPTLDEFNKSQPATLEMVSSLQEQICNITTQLGLLTEMAKLLNERLTITNEKIASLRGVINV